MELLELRALLPPSPSPGALCPASRGPSSSPPGASSRSGGTSRPRACGSARPLPTSKPRGSVAGASKSCQQTWQNVLQFLEILACDPGEVPRPTQAVEGGWRKRSRSAGTSSRRRSPISSWICIATGPRDRSRSPARCIQRPSTSGGAASSSGPQRPARPAGRDPHRERSHLARAARRGQRQGGARQPARQGVGGERLRQPARAGRRRAREGRADPGRRAVLGVGHFRVRGRRPAQGRRGPQALHRAAAARGGAAGARAQLRPAARRAVDRARARARGRSLPLRGARRGLAAPRAARRDPHAQGRDLPHPHRRVRGRQDRLRHAVSRRRAPQGGGRRGARPRAGGAERVRRGAGPMYSAPGEAIREASRPASDPGGFAFRNPSRLPSGRACLPAEAEPESPADTVVFPFDSVGAGTLPEILPAEPTALPEAPASRWTSVAAQGDRHGARRPARLRAAAGAGSGRAAPTRRPRRPFPRSLRLPLRRRARARRTWPRSMRCSTLRPRDSWARARWRSRVPRSGSPSSVRRPPLHARRRHGARPHRARACRSSAAAVGGVLLATAGAWYFLRTPPPPGPARRRRRRRPRHRPRPRWPTLLRSPTAQPVVEPTAAATAAPAPSATPATPVARHRRRPPRPAATRPHAHARARTRGPRRRCRTPSWRKARSPMPPAPSRPLSPRAPAAASPCRSSWPARRRTSRRP